ncbi:MAG TPA: hypothetical protein VFN22_12890 [Gemmatimonadales bacterium]|nr:hypothetical protein [Gemmatimonadales bacterium]
MSSRTRSAPGTTRTCPHCRTTILDSANICPSCRSYLRFDPTNQPKERATVQPLRIEGTVRHTAGGEAWEYNVVVTVTNERGEEVGRHVVGVGALKPDELRQVSLAFEIFVPEGVTPPKDLDVA